MYKCNKQKLSHIVQKPTSIQVVNHLSWKFWLTNPFTW